jgi:TonB family protein
MKRALLGVLCAFLTVNCQPAGAEEAVWSKAMSDASKAVQSSPTQAIQYYEKALAEAQKFGPKDPRLDKTLSALEHLYEAQKNWPKAEVICKQLLGVREKSLGPEHLGYAQSLNNLAVVLALESKYSEADQNYSKALKIVETNLGPENRYVAMILENYAPMLRKANKTAEAEKMEQRLKEVQIAERATAAAATPAEAAAATSVIASASVGRQHRVVDDDAPPASSTSSSSSAPTLIASAASPRFFNQDVNEMLAMANLCYQYEGTATSYKDKGDLKHAEKLYKMALEAAQLSSGPRSMQTVLMTGMLAQCYEKEGRYQLAVPLFRRQLSVYAWMAELDPWRLGVYAKEYADALRAVGEYAQSAQVDQFRKHADDWINDPSTRNASYCAWLQEDRPHVSNSFVAYQRELERMIRQHTQLPYGDESAPPVVTFTISKDGSISHLSMLHTSESLSVDQAALQAVAQAAPFPALPPENQFDVQVEYSFEKQGSATIHHQ